MSLRLDDLRIEYRPLADLKPYAGNARTHSKKQVNQIARSIERFGFVNPILVDEEDRIIAGHGRLEAARLLGLEGVPTVRLSHLSDAERRAYVLADNQLAAKAGWDRDLLAIELQHLLDMDFDVELTGFDAGEIDLVLEEADEKTGRRKEDRVPSIRLPVISRPGDRWRAGDHRILCGDARQEEVYRTLLGNEQVDLVFTDPPYNVPIDGHVCGLGSVKHTEFVMASGEMSKPQFASFLTGFLQATTAHCRDGAILFTCMDWRHIVELLEAADHARLHPMNLCVWNKTNGGMGTFYRSKHELVFVWKHGTAPHVNTFELGQHGRYRTNVWDYAGVNTIKRDRMDELKLHPTVKPVALVADAIKDCSHRGDIVLDPFSGSGTTLIAAERTGRRARVIELDTQYVDVAVRRWQATTGKHAVHEATGQTFEDLEEERGTANENVSLAEGEAA